MVKVHDPVVRRRSYEDRVSLLSIDWSAVENPFLDFGGDLAGIGTHRLDPYLSSANCRVAGLSKFTGERRKKRFPVHHVSVCPVGYHHWLGRHCSNHCSEAEQQDGRDGGRGSLAAYQP